MHFQLALKKGPPYFVRPNTTTLQKLGSKGFLAEHLILRQVILLVERVGFKAGVFTPDVTQILFW